METPSPLRRRPSFLALAVGVLAAASVPAEPRLRVGFSQSAPARLPILQPPGGRRSSIGSLMSRILPKFQTEAIAAAQAKRDRKAARRETDRLIWEANGRGLSRQFRPVAAL